MPRFSRSSYLAVLSVSSALGIGGSANAELLYGVTNLQQLVTFDSNTRAVTSTVSLPGFSITGEILTNIDVRPATGQLYGISNQNNIYVINPTTGVRSQIGSTLNPGPSGTYRLIDFNPTVDRIRVIGSAGSNLRVNPETGAVVDFDMAMPGVQPDQNLAFAAGDVNVGDTPVAVAAAYTNSNPFATSTTLYDLEAGNDVLTTQVPPNNGTLNTVGSVGLNLATSGGFTGFDISGLTGIGYITGNNLGGGVTAPVANSLYSINLATGGTTLLGPVTGVNGVFRDIAVVVPEPASLSLLGLAAGSLLMRRRGAAKQA